MTEGKPASCSLRDDRHYRTMTARAALAPPSAAGAEFSTASRDRLGIRQWGQQRWPRGGRPNGYMSDSKATFEVIEERNGQGSVIPTIRLCKHLDRLRATLSSGF